LERVQMKAHGLERVHGTHGLERVQRKAHTSRVGHNRNPTICIGNSLLKVLYVHRFYVSHCHAGHPYK
jgi:hypothetical protein